MIGPHQGKELELMLAGKKHLAVFCEAVVEGVEISEEIIPENAFSPYVINGQIERFSQDFFSPKLPFPARYVCFSMTGHEWRAKAFFWMHQECVTGKRPFDDAYEFFIGRLLGYEEEDIIDFLSHRKSFKYTPLA
jgi:hypothetical protein